jgi:hypothetical protein
MNIYLNLISPYLRNSKEDFFYFTFYFNYLQLLFDTTFADAKYAGNDIEIELSEK